MSTAMPPQQDTQESKRVNEPYYRLSTLLGINIGKESRIWLYECFPRVLLISILQVDIYH